MLLFIAYHFTDSFFQTGFLLAEEEVKANCGIFNDFLLWLYSATGLMQKIWINFIVGEFKQFNKNWLLINQILKFLTYVHIII